MAEIDFDNNISITVKAGQILSEIIDIGTFKFVGLKFPSNWIKSDISFLASPTLNGFYGSVKSASGEEKIPAVDPDDYILIDHTRMLAIRFFKIQFGTFINQTPQAQDVVIKVILK